MLVRGGDTRDLSVGKLQVKIRDPRHVPREAGRVLAVKKERERGSWEKGLPCHCGTSRELTVHSGVNRVTAKPLEPRCDVGTQKSE